MSAFAQTFRQGTADGYINGRTTDRRAKKAIHTDREYYWVNAQQLQISQGGVGGSALHGPFRSFHANGQLHEEGRFDRGLKDGEWRSWNVNGKLMEVLGWRAGQLHGTCTYYKGIDIEPQILKYKRGVIIVKENKRKAKRTEKRELKKQGEGAEGDKEKKSKTRKAKVLESKPAGKRSFWKRRSSTTEAELRPTKKEKVERQERRKPKKEKPAP